MLLLLKRQTNQFESVFVEVVDELLKGAKVQTFQGLMFIQRSTLRYASCVSGARPSLPIHSISYLEEGFKDKKTQW